MVFFIGKLALHINISLGCKGLSYTNALVYLLASVMKKTVLLFCLMVSNGVIHKIRYGVFHWQAGLTHKYQKVALLCLMVKLINLGWKSFLETNVLAYLLASVTKKRCFYNM
jgi:hypothetical protein